MKTKRYVLAAALAALMLTGTVSGWIIPPHTSTNYGPVFTGKDDAMYNDGFICLDTKFFLPLRPGNYVTAAEQERREALLAVLASHERR